MQKFIFIMIALFFCSLSFAGIQRGIDGHKAGDVIAVSTDEQIANWCNFDKQIVVTQTNILCVYNGIGAKKDFFSN